jgi:UDPglucose 6-dehydrogenase
MRVVIIGTGYVGLTTGVALAYVGHDVTCVDKNPSIVEALRAGRATIHEPNLEDLMHASRRHLSFETELPTLSDEVVVIIAVGTPSRADGDADMAYVDAAAAELAGQIQPGARVVIANKSTVPIGSAQHVDAIVRRVLRDQGVDAEVDVVSNPEFLAEGRAVRDSLYPDRIVVGADRPEAIDVMRRLYQPLLEQTFDRPSEVRRPDRFPLPPLITTTTTSAELTKYAANAFLATKISFINEMAGLAERVGADVTQVARAIGLDDRIGPRFLHAGIGWGGSCFGKDTRAIVATAARYDYDLQLVRASMEVNRLQRLRIVEKLQDHLKVLRGRTIGILGLAFKGGTDDLRESPPLTLIEVLADRGAIVRAHDPIAVPNAQAQHPDLPVTYAEDVVDLARDCDAVVLATDWADYRHPPLEAMRDAMRGTLFLDARNLLDAADVEAAGLTYVGVGR